MSVHINVFIYLISYSIGAWMAFKIFDFRKKGKKAEQKDDRLLWPLLLVFALGGGSLLAYMLKSWLGT
ncbi:MAG: hypothetical protein LJE70_20940 [Chromatiaceae bacterium]|jgi:uncharacterized membrane protein YsdA (DUF1294 family)|nr:hypothetical protein [Chromatiaceae bacterium]